MWIWSAMQPNDDYLREPQRFRSGELGRVADLPIGVERPHN
jgi:hypothetical protein